jgi:pimeloyl-ACP methyl ester carboxylesterase
MDGSGRLLPTQGSLWKYFDVRCLSIPPDDLSDWEILRKKVIYLIKKELKTNSQRRIYLCGESLGGCLALKLIETAPKLFSGLILVNPASSFSQRPWLSLGATITQLMPDFVYFGSTLILLPFLGALERMEASERRALLKAMQSLPPHTVAWRISLLQNFSVNKTPLIRFTNPVLIVASTADRVLPSVEEAKKLTEFFSQADTVILPNSGHACLLEKGINLYQIMIEKNFV